MPYLVNIFLKDNLNKCFFMSMGIDFKNFVARKMFAGVAFPLSRPTMILQSYGLKGASISPFLHFEATKSYLCIKNHFSIMKNVDPSPKCQIYQKTI